jgi:long-chain-fatty-acid--[acyl-carrier-protein] ligase
MGNLMRSILCSAGRLILSLRYRVTVKGLDSIERTGAPMLIVPNHPSLLEPAIVFTHLWPALHPRPMLYSGNFEHPLLKWLLKSFDVIEVPFTREHSAEAREKAEKAVSQVIDGLNDGKTHLMWPSGRIYRHPYERLGGTSALAEIINAAPDARIIAVRTRGMWGSMWGYAWLGTNPDIAKSIMTGIKALLGNLIFFIPRRKLTVTIEEIDRSRLPGTGREGINRFFESWYNAEGPEEAVFVPHHFLFGPRRRDFPELIDDTAVDFDSIKTETKDAVREILEQHLKSSLSPENCQAETELEDLGLDSLERMEVGATVEGRFGFSMDRVPLTFGQLAALADGKLNGNRAAAKHAPPGWFSRGAGSGLLDLPEGTIHRAFAEMALRFGGEPASADDVSGVLTYERMIISALIMARRIKRLESEHVAILLPSSTACAIAFLAVHLAGKIPVMLNWTTGPGNLAHAASLLRITHVITSRRFTDRTGIRVEGTEYLYLEDIKASISRADMIKTFLSVHFNGRAVLKSLPDRSETDTAVVLFTSGSEKAPKAVPLSHRNIISNICSGIKKLEARKDDSLLSILPPFHSFGLTAATLLPLLGGMKMVHHPDPTDASGLIAKLSAYRPTMLFTTPTFLHYVLEKASSNDMQSLRTIVTGAEKCPRSVFDKLKALAPGAELYEGYGITECSPIVSMNSPSGSREGTIGRAIPGVEIRVVDHDRLQPVPEGEMGMLLVSGPGVFSGYIAQEGPPPFAELEGKSWYVTGDLVRVDAEGYIKFSGRLKRFLKAGGEMISLPALEEPFAISFPPTQDGPRVAVEGIEREGRRRIALFTTEEMSAGEANTLLSGKGMKGIMRIDEVIRLEKIPVLGTGKTDYKVLRKMLEDSYGQKD